jgi:hypothetical protein
MRVRIEWLVREGAALEAVLSDRRLSFRAKGVFAYMLSLPQGTGVSVKALSGASSEGRDAIGTALHELSVAGFCERIETIHAAAESADADASSDEVRAPIMESLFGEAFAPPVRMSDLVEARPSEPEEPGRASTERIIAQLNRLRERSWEWAQYTPLSAKYAKNVEHIGGRLRDGYTEMDLIVVLDYLAAVDGGKEESRRYFNCVTPFNTKNFERNLALARDWEAKGRRGAAEKSPGTSRGKEYYLRKGGADG